MFSPDYKKYTVVLRFQYPAHDEHGGIEFDVEARTKADAVRQARRKAEHDGHLPATGKGRATLKAIECDAS